MAWHGLVVFSLLSILITAWDCCDRNVHFSDIFSPLEQVSIRQRIVQNSGQIVLKGDQQQY